MGHLNVGLVGRLIANDTSSCSQCNLTISAPLQVYLHCVSLQRKADIEYGEGYVLTSLSKIKAELCQVDGTGALCVDECSKIVLSHNVTLLSQGI